MRFVLPVRRWRSFAPLRRIAATTAATTVARTGPVGTISAATTPLLTQDMMIIRGGFQEDGDDMIRGNGGEGNDENYGSQE